MKIIGITGGIGSGKSCVLNIIKSVNGSYTVEADKLAHSLLLSGNETYRRVVECFGESIVKVNREIDRAFLREIVMNSAPKLKQLNDIIHPAVKQYILEDINEKRTQNIKYYVIEAALLIQDGYKDICDEIWYIRSDLETRIKRLMESRGYSAEIAEDFIKNQPDEDYYISNSDAVIDNSGTPDELSVKVKNLILL